MHHLSSSANPLDRKLALIERIALAPGCIFNRTADGSCRRCQPDRLRHYLRTISKAVLQIDADRQVSCRIERRGVCERRIPTDLVI